MATASRPRFTTRDTPGAGRLHPSASGDRAASADVSSDASARERRQPGRWIVVAFDGSPAAQRALLRAADEAGERDAVIIVTSTPRTYSARGAAEPRPDAAEPSELLAAARETVAARTSLADVVAVAREGDPAEEVLEVARAAGADLIVVGRRSGRFARTPLGSVATRVVEHAACDVLVVG